jgi:hypothetical protein
VLLGELKVQAANVVPSIYSTVMETARNLDPVAADIRATGRSMLRWMFFFWATINIFFLLIR